MSDAQLYWRQVVTGEARGPRAALTRLGLGVVAGGYRLGLGVYRGCYDLPLLKVERFPCRAIGVGNLTVGGTGKTTTVRWITRRLQSWGARPAIISRGYGSDAAGEMRVVADRESVRLSVRESADEPQMLARGLPGVPVVIGRNRRITGRYACEELGADCLVLDDSFQYWRAWKDAEVLIVSAKQPFGNGRLFPAGLLREPLTAARRAHAAIITHVDQVTREAVDAVEATLRRYNPNLAFARTRHAPGAIRDLRTGAERENRALAGGRWLALSSLGQPESFEETLRHLGCGEVGAVRFPDHHWYSESDIRAAAARARSEGWDGIVTTEKDAVKIEPEWLGETACCVLAVDLDFLTGQDGIERLLRRVVGHTGEESAAHY